MVANDCQPVTGTSVHLKNYTHHRKRTEHRAHRAQSTARLLVPDSLGSSYWFLEKGLGTLNIAWVSEAGHRKEDVLFLGIVTGSFMVVKTENFHVSEIC